jgi:hypothetical protein
MAALEAERFLEAEGEVEEEGAAAAAATANGVAKPAEQPALVAA